MRKSLILALLLIVVCAAPCWAFTKAIADLGNPDVLTNMTHIQWWDGDTTPASIGNLTCRRNVNPAEDLYFFFGIADSFAYQGSRPDMYITIHYYDTGSGSLSMQYDAASDSYKSGGSVALTNSNTWKSKSWHVTDGYFGNRMASGADFRIGGPGSGATFYIDMAYARDFCGPNPRVRVHPNIGRPALDSHEFRELMENPGSWPVTRGLSQVVGAYDGFVNNFTDQELSAFLTQIHNWGMTYIQETGVINEWVPDSAISFADQQPRFDRVVNAGGSLDGLTTDEPFNKCRWYHIGTDQYAVDEMADWMRLMRQRYPGTQITSIEPYPQVNRTDLQWWITNLQNKCAQIGVEGIDCFSMDCDATRIPRDGSWSDIKTFENWLGSNGLPFSMIYCFTAYASWTDQQFYNEIFARGNNYRNAGGAPQEYDVQSWNMSPSGTDGPPTTLPESTAYSFTYSAASFVNEFVPHNQSPYSGVISLPGTVQAENYDNGGEKTAYHDLGIGNSGGQYRLNQSVDVEGCSDTGGGYNVGFIDTGEWMEYTVNVASSGSYDIKTRVASPNSGGSFHVEMNGLNVTGSKTVPNTGGWQTWTTVTASGCSLSGGQQVMRMVIDSGGWNLNHVEVSSAAGGGQSPYAGVISLPGTIQAENFDNGGEGVAYHDAVAGNQGGQYRSTDVDIEGCSDTGGGYNVGYIDTGEWLEYTVNVATTGDYDFYVRVASPNGGSSFKILLDGVDKTGTRGFASTGGWQNWTTIIVPARNLSSGQHILQFNVVTGGFNLNKIDVISRGADAVACDLGSGEVLDGMTHIQFSDGDTVPWTSAGHNCRENVDFPDVYFYFGVSNAWAYQGSKQNVYITFDYYDHGTSTLGLDYDSTTSSYQHVAGPTLTNTNTWKQYTFHVTNAYFGNRENGGADFRFTISGQQEWGIDTVCVYQ